GRAGDDIVIGGNGSDGLNGGAGNDVLEGDAGNDVLDGEGEDDTILGGLGNNTIHGGDGNDTIWAGSRPGEVDCGDGIDTVYAEYLTLGRLERGTPEQVQDPTVREPWTFANCEILIPKTVRDLALSPERPNPQFRDEQGEHGLASNAGLRGAGPPGAGAVAAVNNYNAAQPAPRFGQATNGNDSLSVRGGRSLANDGALYGLGGNDRLEGGDTADQLYGGAGNDGLFGRGGSDVLVGGSGNDTVEGGRGDDLLDGGPGNDHLNGGFGEDSLSGGSGNDTITSLAGGRDTINCGAGNDRVIKDRTDVAVNCERIG
ncbi:MAG: hypothetical protein QOG94_3830, partial [Solirubrobacteraceae bacterium]|nr:hypothetical protein [Solirubrobacteraceae bacterium]